MVTPVPALRLFVRASPFLLGAAVVAIWLRRRERVERPALPPPVEAEETAPTEPPGQSTVRFDREPVDIVAVVDDLLDSRAR